MHETLKTYHQKMGIFREAIQRSESVARISDEVTDKDVLLTWLINFTTRGIKMTEPVEGWISRAGERCVETGLPDVGRQLIKHASQERDHHLMMIEDASHLVDRWNATHDTKLDLGVLIARPATRSVQAYIDLHEEVIASDTPYRQVAIEREIEGLSLVAGPMIIARCRAVFGKDGLSEISFITDHVELDVGHTAFNEKLLTKLLAARPDAVENLVAAGSEALKTYLGFMSDCLIPDFYASRLPAEDSEPAGAALDGGV